MTVHCDPDHLLVHPLPDGLALYPFARRPSEGYAWLAGEPVLEHLDRLERPAVHVDVWRVEAVNSGSFSGFLRLGMRARDRAGRVFLYNTQPYVGEVFRMILGLNPSDPFPWPSVTEGRMPGGNLPDPAWLSWNDGTVAAMARRVDEDQDFGLLPVLGDALEDAGCTFQEVLEHCRGAGPHVRTCWVLRLLLGKP